MIEIFLLKLFIVLSSQLIDLLYFLMKTNLGFRTHWREYSNLSLTSLLICDEQNSDIKLTKLLRNLHLFIICLLFKLQAS